MGVMAVYCPECEAFVALSRTGNCLQCGRPYTFEPVVVDEDCVVASCGGRACECEEEKGKLSTLSSVRKHC